MALFSPIFISCHYTRAHKKGAIATHLHKCATLTPTGHELPESRTIGNGLV
jgi:hypothetical protein